MHTLRNDVIMNQCRLQYGPGFEMRLGVVLTLLADGNRNP